MTMTTTTDATCATVELPADLITRLNALAELLAADAHHQPQNTSTLVTAAVEMMLASLGNSGYGAHRFRHPGTATLAVLSGTPPTPSNRKDRK